MPVARDKVNHPQQEQHQRNRNNDGDKEFLSARFRLWRLCFASHAEI
jgi:hypothetical protein